MDNYKPIGGPNRVLYLLIGFIICAIVGSTNFTMAVNKGKEENKVIMGNNPNYTESDLCVVEKVKPGSCNGRRCREDKKTVKFNLDNCSKKVKKLYITGITFLCITFIILIILLFIFINYLYRQGFVFIPVIFISF